MAARLQDGTYTASDAGVEWDMPLYNLYIVTAMGYFTAISGARPTRDRDILDGATRLIDAVRPGRGRYYELYIATVTEDWIPDDISRRRIIGIQDKLRLV